MLQMKKILLLLGLIFNVLTINSQNFEGVDIFANFEHSIKYPALSPDGKHLIFAAEENGKTVIYESFFKLRWLEPTKFNYFNELMATSGNEVGGFSFNHDATKIYFHAKIQGTFFDIYYTQKTPNGWNKPTLLGKPFSTGADLFSPTISSDNKTIFVLKADPEGDKKCDCKCKKLLLFEKNDNNEWVGPKYLFEKFNFGCQETPFFAADNKLIFFASRRKDVDKDGKRVSDNDYNIYYARRIDENNWYYPALLDGINTKFDDLSPIIDRTGNRFFMTSMLKKKNSAKIYSVKLPAEASPQKTFMLSGKITDLYSKRPVAAKIKVQNAVTFVTLGEFDVTEDGKYSIILTKGVFYKIDFSSNAYSHKFYYKNLTYRQNDNQDSISKVSETDKNEDLEEVFNVSLFNNINLELNIYDNRLFYPLSPVLTVEDIENKRVIPQKNIVKVSEGKYNCNLEIGKIYKITVESENIENYSTNFDLRTDVIYSNFEKSIELSALRKPVTLNVAAELLPVNIEIKNLSRNEIAQTLLDENAQKQPLLLLRTNDNYELNVSKKGYTYYNSVLNYPTTTPETIDINLEKLTRQTKMVFNNITFETNSAELNFESFAELNRIVRFLKENADIKVEISAHTDDVGADDYNFRLSDKRAASAVNFLINSGISKDRMVSKGFGKTQPLVANDTDAHRTQNRRVEIRIIETKY